MGDRDPLTQALTRDAIHVVMGQFRDLGPIAQHSLLLIDIDHFKHVNYTLGHDTGDLVLCEIVALLRSMVPAGSEVGRLGGDEFLVFLPGTGIVLAQELAESIRGLFASSTRSGLTLTIGIATTPAEGQWDCHQLVGLADLRMVVAKKRLRPGRNCTWAGDLPAGWTGPHFLEWPTSAPYPPSAW
jgi:diguanylate cyclase (GGDEF)-like protein